MLATAGFCRLQRLVCSSLDKLLIAHWSTTLLLLLMLLLRLLGLAFTYYERTCGEWLAHTSAADGCFSEHTLSYFRCQRPPINRILYQLPFGGGEFFRKINNSEVAWRTCICGLILKASLPEFTKVVAEQSMFYPTERSKKYASRKECTGSLPTNTWTKVWFLLWCYSDCRPNREHLSTVRPCSITWNRWDHSQMSQQ